jgi:hypothetical protein
MKYLGDKGNYAGEKYLLPIDDRTYAHPEIFGKPAELPKLKAGQFLFCAFHKYSETPLYLCESYDDVSQPWDLRYCSGAGEKIVWYTGFIARVILHPAIIPEEENVKKQTKNTHLTEQTLVEFFNNRSNWAPSEEEFGSSSTDFQPRHGSLHIRYGSRLKIGRLYNLRRAGRYGLGIITGKFLGIYDSGKLCFEFRDGYIETYRWCELGLSPYPEEETGKWGNWTWIEAVNIWQAIF